MDNTALLAQFGGEEVRAVSTKSTPILKMLDAAGIFLHGILLNKKERKEKDLDDKGNQKVTTILTFKLIATSANAVKSTGKKGADGKTLYAPVTVAAGDEVTIYGAPTRLARYFTGIADGSEVLVVYEGKKSETVNGRRISAHNFQVRRKAVETAVVPD